MKVWDTIIIGSGPAGLTAAMYLARFRRSVLVLHDNRARALKIPKTHNAPGFPDGVSGVELIERMTAHATTYGADIAQAEITGAKRETETFRVTSNDDRTWQSRSLILATGVCLNQVDMPEDEHQAAVDAGILRYCPVCDGYEHIDSRIGVVGCDSHGAAEALFLRRFSPDVTMIPNNFAELDQGELAKMREAGIQVIEQPLERLQQQDNEMLALLSGETTPLAFDVVYPALGSTPRNDLAQKLGLECTNSGELEPAAPFATSVEGLYAAGDIVDGLDQISVAMGHGAIAATKVHNWLRDRDGHSL